MITCMGFILEVNLTTGEIKKTKVPEDVYYNVLAGKGLGAWYCLREIPAGADPLGPDNVLGFTSGALTGAGVMMAGRTTVVGKSPLTGGWGDASIGGIFSPAIKQCGVDAIFFRGQAEKPVFLYMDNKVCELRDASKYWGLDTIEAEQMLIADNTDKNNDKPLLRICRMELVDIALPHSFCRNRVLHGYNVKYHGSRKYRYQTPGDNKLFLHSYCSCYL